MSSAAAGIAGAWGSMDPAQDTKVEDDSTMQVEHQYILKLAGSDNYRCCLKVSEEKVYSAVIDIHESYRYYSIYVAAGAWRGYTDKTLPDFIKINLSLIASYKGDSYNIYDEIPAPYDSIGFPFRHRISKDAKYYIVVVSREEIEVLRHEGSQTFPVVEIDIKKYHTDKRMNKQLADLEAQKMAQQMAINKQQAMSNQLGNQSSSYAQQMQSAIQWKVKQDAWANTTSGLGNSNVSMSPHLQNYSDLATVTAQPTMVQLLKEWWNTKL